jgi:hypothetical protein
MEKAAAGAGAGARWNKLPGRCSALALVAGTAAAPVVAQVQAPASADWLIAQVGPDQQPLRVQVRTSALPRIEAQDSGFQAPRVDVSISPADGHGLSPVLGFSSAAPAPTPAGLQPQRPSLDVGLRWSHPLRSQQIDVMAWRRMNAPDDDAYTLAQARQPTYGARVELNLSPVRKSGLALDRGFVGMQLEGGARITIKRKDGRPMVYYRSAF